MGRRPACFMFALTLLALFASPSAMAQRMYRCGNTYQDRPCDTGETKVVGHSNTAAPSTNSNVDAECARRGAEAQKIVWTRETGVTEETMLADARDPARRRLVSEVYRNRGSAPVVRAAVEADCMAEKEREAEAAALLKALNAARGQNQPPVAPAAQTVPETHARRGASTSAAAADKKTRCDRLQERSEEIHRKQRKGGSAALMDSLNEQQREIDGQRFSLGCNR